MTRIRAIFIVFGLLSIALLSVTLYTTVRTDDVREVPAIANEHDAQTDPARDPRPPRPYALAPRHTTQAAPDQRPLRPDSAWYPSPTPYPSAGAAERTPSAFARTVEVVDESRSESTDVRQIELKWGQGAVRGSALTTPTARAAPIDAPQTGSDRTHAGGQPVAQFWRDRGAHSVDDILRPLDLTPVRVYSDPKSGQIAGIVRDSSGAIRTLSLRAQPSPVDVDQDGNISQNDFQALIEAYFQKSDRADINKDDAVSPSDIEEFILLFAESLN